MVCLILYNKKVFILSALPLYLIQRVMEGATRLKKIVPIAIVLASTICLMVSLSVASDYAFGTKVSSQDNDLGRPLKNMPDGTIISFWDIGTNLGIYDAGDVVYVDTPPVGIVNSNDIRITPFGNHHAGSKVTPSDEDMNVPLKPLAAEIRFLNLNGSRSYDLNDPVYVHQSNVPDLTGAISSTNNANGPIINPVAPSPSMNYPTTATNIAAINPDNATNGQAAYATDTKENTSTGNNYDPSVKEGFWQRLSYTGSCDNLPIGTTCLTYEDGFIWTVSDYLIDNNPSLVGFDNNGRPIESIHCETADYYHIIGTLFVKSVPKQKSLVIQSAPSQYVPNSASSPEGIVTTNESYSDGEYLRKVLNAVKRIGTNYDSIQTNDVRLTSVGGLASGTKVLNFDPDLNKLVALPVLVSFPRKSDDYASIRVYDTNGNGLYDSYDDVYLDVSFPGYSSFGTVSVNDVRLSDRLLR
jgi:hypothetical protein